MGSCWEATGRLQGALHPVPCGTIWAEAATKPRGGGAVDTHHSQPQTPMITQRELARHMASAAATALWESGNYREPDTYGMSLGLAQLVLKSSTISNRMAQRLVQHPT